MVEFVTRTAPTRDFAPGSADEMHALDPHTLMNRHQPGSSEFASTYLPELDPRLSMDERRAAKAERLAVEQATMQAAAVEVANGTIPNGYVVVRHASDENASVSVGLRLDERGHYLVKASDVEALSGFGFRPVKYERT